MSPTSAPASEAQIAANRANAQRSTGPRTPEGKNRSRTNALRHGLTGRIVVLPEEDLAAYNAFSAELFPSLTPETPVERQYAQTFIDTQWRLNRMRGIEDGMFSLGHFEAAGDIECEHPEIHTALTHSRVFRGDSQSFVNLSLYEQRLHRTLKESLRQLQELQAQRLAARQAVMRDVEPAAALPPVKSINYQSNPPARPAGQEPIGFVLSTAQQQRLADLQYAETLGYNLDEYSHPPLKRAA